MKVIEPSYEILTDISEGGIEELKHIEFIGRKCYKSEDKISADGETAKKFVKDLITRKHGAMLEHGMVSVLFTVDRGVTHELVRHRIASFAQESTRYVNYAGAKEGNEITVIRPCFFEEGTEEYKVWYDACKNCEDAYMALRALKRSPQEARSVLPTSTKADIVVSANYRELRHIFNLRAGGTTGAPHPQMHQITVPLLLELQEKMPVFFDDITPYVYE